MSAAWRAAVAAAARAPLRGRLAGMRPPRNQRRPSAWGAAAAAALVGGGCLVACYSGRPRVFPTVLAQLKDKRRESHQLQTPDIISSNSSRITE